MQISLVWTSEQEQSEKSQGTQNTAKNLQKTEDDIWSQE